MSAALAGHVADYLRLRRALGFKLEFEGQVLPQFVAYLEGIGAQSLTVEAAIAWTRLSEGAQPSTLSHRLGTVRGFARYLATIDPVTEIPPCGLFGKQQRYVPYIYSPEEITWLLDAAGQLRPQLRALIYQTLFGLLAATGMRVGEALRLAGAGRGPGYRRAARAPRQVRPGSAGAAASERHQRAGRLHLAP